MLKCGFTLKNFSCILILMIYFGTYNGLNLHVGDVLKSAKDITTSVIHDVANSIPTPKGLYSITKQLIAGYPFEIVGTLIDKLCAAALSSKTITPRLSPDGHRLQFQMRTRCKKYSVPLTQAKKLWTVPEFDPLHKVVVVVTGWQTTVNTSDAIDEFELAYGCRGGVNFLALDVGYYVDTLYTWSAYNTEVLGMELAKALKDLVEVVPIRNIHLIGHSLGAHIVGAAGQYFQKYTGSILQRITGLDPAKPCFNEGESLTGLTRGDADFVDIIHSNPGILGIRQPIGDIDFYPGGLGPLPDGCFTVACAHGRAWEYFVESVYPGNEKKYVGMRCRSLIHLRSGNCNQLTAIMGYGLLPNRKGNYILEAHRKFSFTSNNFSDCAYVKRQCSTN